MALPGLLRPWPTTLPSVAALKTPLTLLLPLLQAMSVVLAHAAYLPTAQCFALLPLVGGFCRTGSTSGAVMDYDLDRQAVTVVAQRPYRCARVGVVPAAVGRDNGSLRPAPTRRAGIPWLRWLTSPPQ